MIAAAQKLARIVGWSIVGAVTFAAGLLTLLWLIDLTGRWS